jgi:hypothetical protein
MLHQKLNRGVLQGTFFFEVRVKASSLEFKGMGVIIL